MEMQNALIKPESKLAIMLREAIERRNIQLIDTLTTHMRFKLQFDYETQYQIAHNLTGIDEADWDELLYGCDCLENENDLNR